MADVFPLALDELVGKDDDWIDSRVVDLGQTDVAHRLVMSFASRLDSESFSASQGVIDIVVILPDGEEYECHILASSSGPQVHPGPSGMDTFYLYWESIVDFARAETGEIRLLDAVGCGRARMLGSIDFVYEVIGSMRKAPHDTLPDLSVRYQFLAQCRENQEDLQKFIADRPEDFKVTFLTGISAFGQAMAMAGVEDLGITPVVLRQEVFENPNLSYDIVVEGSRATVLDNTETEKHVLIRWATGLDYIRAQIYQATEVELLREGKLQIRGDQSVIDFIVQHWTRVNF